MKIDISTIPINEVFSSTGTCPICRLSEMLEARCVEYITGAAMMEPDVRIETNAAGFCGRHFHMMLGQGKRLQNALILESHLQSIIDEYFSNKKINRKSAEGLEKMLDSCFVCDKIKWGTEHLVDTVLGSWMTDDDFRRLFESQDYICLPHTALLLKRAVNKGIPSKKLSEFTASLNSVSGKYLNSLKKDITKFCSMYDYRNQGKEFGSCKDSIERSIIFLTGENNIK